MTLNGVMALHCVISLNLVHLRCRKRSVAEFMQGSIVFLVRVQCRRKESSRSLSHLLMQGRIIHEAGEAEASGPGRGPDRPVQRKFTQSRTTLGPEIVLAPC